MATPTEFRRSLLVAGVRLVSVVALCVATSALAAVPADRAAQESGHTAQSALSLAQNPRGTNPSSQPKPRPLASEQAAVKHPEVTYEDGMLTIVAENVPLSEVLAAVRQAMGADIDIPAGAATQHIWVRSGPGPARKILRDLLDGTELDYVIQASESDLDGVRSVMLTPRSKASEVSSPAIVPIRSASRRIQPASSALVDSPATDNPDSDEKVASSEPTATMEPPQAPADAQSAATNIQPPSSLGSSSLSSGPGSGSPEQMIQQLQNMYQQRRQIQVQQNQKPPVAN